MAEGGLPYLFKVIRLFIQIDRLLEACLETIRSINARGLRFVELPPPSMLWIREGVVLVLLNLRSRGLRYCTPITRSPGPVPGLISLIKLQRPVYLLGLTRY